MNSDHIDYPALMHKSMIGIIRELLCDAASEGLPGDHHFYLSFDTTFPGVDIPAHLAERHPGSMTIVLQHQFWDLTVTDEAFSVKLSFNGNQEALHIPLESLTAFMDPSVQFGLQLRENMPEREIVDVSEQALDLAPEGLEAEDIDQLDEEAPAADASEDGSADGDDEPKDNVITLDRFRNS